MVFPSLFKLLIICLYLLGTASFLLGMGLRKDKLKSLAGGFAIAGFLIHSFQLLMMLVSLKKTILLAGGFYLSAMAWILILTYLIMWLRLKSMFLALTALPLALLLFVSSLAVGGATIAIPPYWTVLFFGLHIGTLLVTMVLLALAFASALAFLRLNNKIKTKAALSDLGEGTQSLSIFDKVNNWAVSFGFPLFTLGIFSGFVWNWLDPQKAFAWGAMNIISIAVWFLYAVLFYQRLIIGWRGRKPAIMIIYIFALMVVSLIHHAVSFKSL